MQPHHPYTLGLMRCVPRSGVRYTAEALYSIPGRVPALTGFPEGCAFAERCPLSIDACLAAHPPLKQTPSGRITRHAVFAGRR